MSQKANPTLIGGFVLGALVLLVGGVLLFGKGLFFAPKRQQFVIYFSDSVNGLNVGAPVKLKGVTVGTVKDVRVQYDVENARLLTPVIIDFEPERVTDIGGQKRPEVPRTQALIERGLRAQLQMQSLVTGQLYVEANFLPGHPGALGGRRDPGFARDPEHPFDRRGDQRHGRRGHRRVPPPTLARDLRCDLGDREAHRAGRRCARGGR